MNETFVEFDHISNFVLWVHNLAITWAGFSHYVKINFVENFCPGYQDRVA